MLAFFVVFPLGMLLTLPLGAEHPIPFKVVLFLQPFAAFIAAMSFFLPKGVISGTFAIIWLPLVVFATWNGLQSVQTRGIRYFRHNPAELCFVVAQFYI
ncbi:MAG: YndJ family transporter, partial [Anaerolineales bacterium]|nr:YndJ family transporter [Anaerolineales bacterium]